MSAIDSAVKKVRSGLGSDLEHYLSAFATDLLMTQAIAYDSNGNTEYIGYALAGSAKTAPVWLIKKLTYDVSNRVTDIQFANGVIAFDQVWNNRGSIATYA